MAWYIVIGSVALLTAWYISYRSGNPTFWKLASRHPDEAYDWLMTEDCWVVLDHREPTPVPPDVGSDYTGPFMLWIPKLGGRRITIYGKSDEIERSERRFIERFDEPDSRSQDSMQLTPQQVLADVDLAALRLQLGGAEYRKLVEQHLRRLGPKLELSILASVEACTEDERRVGEALIDEYNIMAHDQSFWRRDCGEVFEEICTRFEAGMTESEARAEDSGKFNAFQIITMNLAYMARDQKALRKFAGIRKSVFLR